MDPNEPAFPGTKNGCESAGLTKREYMATQILAAFVPTFTDNCTLEGMVKTSIAVADLLIDGLNKPRKESPK